MKPNRPLPKHHRKQPLLPRFRQRRPLWKRRLSRRLSSTNLPRLSQDVPPFTLAHRVNEICGLNVVGLRRAGFTAEQRLELKRVYHLLFRSGKNLRAAMEEAQNKFTSPTAKILLDFIAATKRGVCRDVGGGASENKDE